VVVGAEGRERERGISGVLGLRIESMRDPRVEGGREGGGGLAWEKEEAFIACGGRGM
jgi:hypothetical protein